MCIARSQRGCADGQADCRGNGCCDHRQTVPLLPDLSLLRGIDDQIIVDHADRFC